MDVTFHETKLFFVRPLLYMEKTLEADELFPIITIFIFASDEPPQMDQTNPQ